MDFIAVVAKKVKALRVLEHVLNIVTVWHWCLVPKYVILQFKSFTSPLPERWLCNDHTPIPRLAV